MTVSPATKTARHALIAAILAHPGPPVRSQEELAERLSQRGLRVTQATLSRDLEELGAVRLRAAGGALVYALPGQAGGPGSLPGGLAEVTDTNGTDEGAAPEEPEPGTGLGVYAAGWRGWPLNCWSRPRPAPTWWCCGPRPEPRSSWPR